MKSINIAFRIVFLIANTLFLGVFPSTLVWYVGNYSCPHVLRQVLAIVNPSVPVNVEVIASKMNLAFYFWRTVGMAVFGFISGMLVLKYKKGIIRFLEEL